MTNRWVIIPIKNLNKGKSRLAGIFSEETRREVVITLVSHTLETISNSKGIDQIVVVSQDDNLLDIGRQFRTRTLKEYGQPDLNQAINLGTKTAIAHYAECLIVIPVDLPLITSKDIEEVISLSESSPELIIAPDRQYMGTNLLMISPPGMIQYTFGDNSFTKHLDQAINKKMSIKVIDRKPWNLDLDLPEDFRIIREYSNPIVESILKKVT